MARPRIFVSSTFYDLKQIRADLERFIKALGYDPVLNERGLIPYLKEDALEESCYREIATVDIMVAVVGGRFGSSSLHKPYSVSQQEIKTALENGKPVFIFIQRDVYAEYETYKQNKDNATIQYAAVSDRKVFLFLDELNALPNNNPIASFDRSEDITIYLQEQWAGLFQRFLSEQMKREENNSLARMASVTNTLNQLVQLLSENKRDSDYAVKEILLTTHPIFAELKQLTGTSYRIFFTTHKELELWLKARSYSEVEETILDSPEYEEWVTMVTRSGVKKRLYLHIAHTVFDSEGRLKIFTPSEWDSNWVYVTEFDAAPVTITEDDIPF